MTSESHFAHLSDELVLRAARAVVSQLGPASPALRQHLVDRLGARIGTPGSFLTEPVFESLFDWELHDEPVEKLPYLSKRLIDALDQPDERWKDLRFPRDRRPRTHQRHAWEVLCNDPVRSVLVRTGTASGKTECFMVPVLEDLARQLGPGPQPEPLEGVQALFLYPLNALIQSQRNRLRAWCSGFHGAIRFALYNGLTKEREAAEKRQAHPEQVLDRQGLRASPPPVLVTNATMLEYMLVRGADAGILARSQGKLRWIILDEAHTYLGSAAAEVALLLRRVMDAFAVDPKDVRFVATSATIGDADAAEVTAKLKQFLADLGGIQPAQVEVVDGRRVAPPLAEASLAVSGDVPTPEVLRALQAPERFRRMAESEALRGLRARLTNGHMSLSEVARSLDGDATHKDGGGRALALLDLVSSTAPGPGEKVFLPLRGHFFARTMAGLWACCDRDCSVADEALRPRGEGWGFGALYTERRTHCACGALCFEVQLCRACGEAYLAAYRETDGGPARWTATEPEDADDDDFAEVAPDGDDEEAEPTKKTGAKDTKRPKSTKEAAPKEPRKSAWNGRRVLLVADPQAHGTVRPQSMRRGTGEHIEEGADVIERAYIPEGSENPRCVRCHEGHRGDRPLVMSARLGANFFLNVNVPTLLEQEDPHTDHVAKAAPTKKPAEGRRLLTFTDSRQGSARFALRTGLGAERNFTRAFVYHALWAKAKAPDAAKLELLRSQIEALRAMSPVNPLRAMLPALERDLAQEQAGGAPVPWDAMVSELAQCRELSWVRDAMELAFPPARALGERDIARIALLREFARRPRRANSLETMGLVAVDYAGLDAVGPSPTCWLDADFREDEWRPFLKLAIDFFVRNLPALLVDREDFRWIGVHFSTPLILAPDDPPPDDRAADGDRPTGRGERNKCYPWPSASPGRAPTRLHRYLRAMFDPAMKDSEARPAIDAILRAAWGAVTGARVLTKGQGGWRLDLAAQGRFRVVREAWLCPMTGRLLDTTLRRRSPYLHGDWAGPKACETVPMPALVHAFPQTDGVPASRVLAWLDSDPVVRAARAIGAWNELSDRIAAFAPTLYFRAGEHSAQQRAAVLERLEDGFNAHDINVLSCSTTMEMGVDIGGLNTVAMNNVPPAPANYRQRAGRAGRSGAARATVFTLCNTSPHGEAVFRDPLWPFTSPVAVPRVSLDSRRIVERHVNALCLGIFFRERQITRGTGLECCGFFLASPDGDGDASRSTAQRFAAWLAAPAGAPLSTSLRRLTGGTGLAGEPPERLLARAAEMLEGVATRWLDQRTGALTTLADVGGEEGMNFQKADAAQKAALLHLRRHDEEYLLRYLTAEGFLPAHGFPMFVVPFVTLTREVLDDARQRVGADDKTREDVTALRNDLPSRHLGLAIREYAPGAGVTLNGMVYEVAGVTLAWKRPTSEGDARGIHDLGWVWRCKRCGAADVARGERPTACAACGHGEVRPRALLRPAGFAVDFFSKPHNDLAQQTFVPVDEPYLSASGAPWRALGGAPVGRYRHSAEGTVVFRNRGASRCGYAVCLHCGRAAPEREYPEQGRDHERPEGIREHLRLRGSKGDGARCTGNDAAYAVRRNVVLGGVERTDVLEVQLHDPATGAPLGAPGEQQVVYTTLAVALRRVVADHLGVDPREIGWSAGSVGDPDGATRWSIFLFDTADGGAGYVTAVVDSLGTLVARLPDSLRCRRSCDAACHGCLLAYDTQWHADHLHWKVARAALPDDLHAGLALPDALRVFGEASALECLPLREAFELALQGSTPKAVRVCLGTNGVWDMESWSLSSRLRTLVEQGVTVTLVVPEARLAALSWSEARELHQQSTVGGFRVLAATESGAGGAGVVLELEAAPRGRRWAIARGDAWAPGPDWGGGDGACPLIVAPHDGALPALRARPVKPVEIDRLPPDCTRHFAWPAGSLTGDIARVGERFWDGLMAAHPPLAGALRGPTKLLRVFLRDRYVSSPLVMRVAFEVFARLKGLGAADAGTTFELETRWNVPDRRAATSGAVEVHHGLASRTTQREVLAALWGELGRGTTRVLDNVHHDRVLVLAWPQGSMTIHLHQGVSFLRSEGAPRVTLGSDFSALARQIRTATYRVAMADSTTVHLSELDRG